jgi:dTDP-4-dehydrorhamnose reductase
MLGSAVVALSPGCTPTDRTALDITNASAVADAVAGHDVVINAAGWTDVDGAESREEAATAVNGDGPANLASACAKHDATLIHISTDYVFSGLGTIPWPENETPAPINAYGRSKLLGEQAVLRADGYVVRTAWLYGAGGKNFVRTILGLAETRQTLDVVDDQYGQPTWTHALAVQLLDLARAARAGRAPAGIYHGTASGRTTWYGLAQAAFSETGLDPARIRPVTSRAFPRPARRPAFSVLGHDRWTLSGVDIQPDWRRQLHTFLTP